MKSQDERALGTAGALHQMSYRDELVQELDEHSANTLMARAFEEGGVNYPRWKVEILVEGFNYLLQGRCDLEGTHKRAMAKARAASAEMLQQVLADETQGAPEHA